MAKGKFIDWITPEGLLKIEGWARDGLTDEQIAKNIGISRSTLNDWKSKFPDISDTIKRGKEVVDRMVENALLKRALGYSYDETTYEQVWDQRAEKYKLGISKVVKKEVQPDTTAQIFWLKNRKPGEWRDKQDIQMSGSLDVRQQLEKMSDEELQKMAGVYDVEE